MSEESGRQVGRCRLVRCIGQGGMGRVWLAGGELLDRDVAIRAMLFRVGLADAELADPCRRTLREARAAARLGDPNVVGVHDVVTVEDPPWTVMQYLPSRSLHRWHTDVMPERTGRR